MSPRKKRMINQTRLQALTNLMTEQGWDILVFYGHTWRKDFFRYLVNANFWGAYAAAALSRSGDVRVILADPWDYEMVAAALGAGVGLERDFHKRFMQAGFSHERRYRSRRRAWNSWRPVL